MYVKSPIHRNPTKLFTVYVSEQPRPLSSVSCNFRLKKNYVKYELQFCILLQQQQKKKTHSFNFFSNIKTVTSKSLYKFLSESCNYISITFTRVYIDKHVVFPVFLQSYCLNITLHKKCIHEHIYTHPYHTYKEILAFSTTSYFLVFPSNFSFSISLLPSHSLTLPAYLPINLSISLCPFSFFLPV